MATPDLYVQILAVSMEVLLGVYQDAFIMYRINLVSYIISIYV